MQKYIFTADSVTNSHNHTIKFISLRVDLADSLTIPHVDIITNVRRRDRLIQSLTQGK